MQLFDFFWDLNLEENYSNYLDEPVLLLLL